MKAMALLPLPILVGIFLTGCSESKQDSAPSAEQPDSLCDSACDSSPLTYPEVIRSGGYGAVTTYGNVTDPEFSSGGACNYGPTRILNYAAVHVNIEPGDDEGIWDGGRHCGDCLRVQVGSDTGWRSIVVRIVDKCPDTYCGVDLGGNPAKELMGSQPGRYNGKWEWVDCEGAPGVSDGEPALYVKEGSNAWWSIVQVRNGPSAVVSMSWEGGEFSWASEAENFYKVPEEVLKLNEEIRIFIKYRNGEADTLTVTGTDLGMERGVFLLKSRK